MKLLLALLAILAVASCGFNIPGVYSVSGNCNPYQCPNTYTKDGRYQFVCPQNGSGNGQITYNNFTSQYTIELRTIASTYQGGYIAQNFTSRNIVTDPRTRDQQIQIPLNQGYVLNLQPCYRGNLTSYMCPNDPAVANRTMVGWKTVNGTYPQGCNFVLIRNN